MPFPPSALEVVHALPRLAARPADANKGSFGRVLIVAGSRDMSGAAILCGSAALRGGAGLVRVALPQSVLPVVAAGNPCYMTAPLPEDAEGRLAAAARDELLGLARANTVVAIGPGLGRSSDLSDLVLNLIEQTRTPLVVDADGLNALQGQAARLRGRSAPLVLTPHPGELARLLNSDVASVQADRQGLAVRFAAEHGLVLVLKGQGTVVTDGRRVYVNATGNPGLATGGTGDVLTGLVAALLGQGLEAFAAAQLGVYLHGKAGDLARDQLGEVSLIASDLLAYLPRAFRSLGGSDTSPSTGDQEL
jgi:NAD(P)H-hydrate epimerase